MVGKERKFSAKILSTFHHRHFGLERPGFSPRKMSDASPIVRRGLDGYRATAITDFVEQEDDPVIDRIFLGAVHRDHVVGLTANPE